MDLQQFYAGTAFDADTLFGVQPQGTGFRFATWAPAARRVQVIGEWNAWQGEELHRSAAAQAVWECCCTAARPGQMYKFRITGADGATVDHCDPYGRAMELRPGGASRVQAEPAYAFTDAGWMAARTLNFDEPLNIYEVHAGSWRQNADGSFATYAELAKILPQYAAQSGFTHIELMPLAEHPFDGSWGYQTTGFFAPTSRYGTPEGLCALVDACHAAGVGVILDFVPVHFAVDDYGLHRYDGTALYEYPAAAVGQSEWGSCNFMHSRGEVRSFLQSCAAYWLRVFHADGLRMDAVSHLIYWQGDAARGVNNDAVQFLKNMNDGLHARFPTAMLIAEDSTNFLKVTAPVAYEGLGFDYKWDLGWMNDTLDYCKKPVGQRQQNYGRLTFSMMYCYNEHYILPLSHDENVHGKATVLQKMYGTYEEKFPQGRLLYLAMAIHPGKKLNFMGAEIGQLREWDETRAQDWTLRSYPLHDAFYAYWKALWSLYRSCDAFWAGEYDPAHFVWLDCDGAATCTCAMLRRGREQTVFAVLHFGDKPLEGYRLNLPAAGSTTLLLDTDWTCWGGASPRPEHCGPNATDGSFAADLAPYSGQLYRFDANGTW